MPKPLEISIRRALASGKLTPRQISEMYGVNLNRVKALVRDTEKDLAA